LLYLCRDFKFISMTFAEYQGLMPADVIITPKSDFNVVKHFVVFHGFDIYGSAYYLENKQGHGVRQINEATFRAENHKFETIRRFAGNDYDRTVAIGRGIALVGKPYDLWKFNCEHFANHVQYNSPISVQVNNFHETLLKSFGVAAAITAVFGLASLIKK
jgi:hypothetical protein